MKTAISSTSPSALPTREMIRADLLGRHLNGFEPSFNVVRSHSKGTIVRYISLVTGKECGCMSEIEARFAQIHDFDPRTKNLMVQYGHRPEWTQAIARSIGYTHPADDLGNPYELSTDIVSVFDAGETLAFGAVDVKEAAELQKEDTLAKLELKRRLWAIADIPYVIATDTCLPMEAVKAIEFVWQFAKDKTPPHINIDLLPPIDQFLLDELAGGKITLGRACRRCDETFSLENGAALDIAKWLVASKRWSLVMSAPFHPTRPVAFHAA